MPIRANPYQADAGQYNAIGQGINNLGQAFLAANDPLAGARAEQAAWAARANREKVMDAMDARGGRGQLGELLRTFDPTGDHRELFAQGVGSGAMDPDDLGGLFRTMMANFGGSDEQVARSFAGAGDAIGVDDAFSLGGRDQVAGRNHQYDVARDQATPTLNEALGRQFMAGQLGVQDIYPNRFAAANKYNAEAGQVGAPGSRDELMAWTAIHDSPEAAGALRPHLYGPGGGAGGPGGADGLGGVDELAATRRSALGEAADEAINNYATDLGLDPSDIPTQLRGALLDGAVRMMLDDSAADPRAAVSQLWQQFGMGAEPRGLFGRGRELVYDQEAMGGGDTQLAQPDAPRHSDPNLTAAVSAVARGADPRAVRERLMQHGYTDGQIAEAGL